MAEKDKHRKGCGNVSPQSDPIQAAIYYGIDVTTLRDNLSRTEAASIKHPTTSNLFIPNLSLSAFTGFYLASAKCRIRRLPCKYIHAARKIQCAAYAALGNPQCVITTGATGR
jgi:hypothetical protein